MSHQTQFILIVLAGIVFIVLELRYLYKKIKNLRKVQATLTLPLERIQNLGEGATFEFCAQPLTNDEISPITRKPCLAWSFDVICLTQTNGSSHSVPVIAMESDFKWVLFEAQDFLLAVRSHIDGPTPTETFTHTSVLGAELPMALSRFLNSPAFKTHSEKYLSVLARYPSHAITFRESILLNQQAYQVHGEIRKLKLEETQTINLEIQKRNIQKPVHPFTLSGESFRVSNFSEKEMVHQIKKEIWMHCYLLIFGIGLLTYLF